MTPRPLIARIPGSVGDLQPCPTCGGTSLRLYTIGQAAQLWGVSVDWVYDRIKAGEIRVTDLGNGDGDSNKKWRISTPEMVRIINERTA
jgi:excisionase family DNA binding protein